MSSVQLAVEKLQCLFEAREAEVEVVIMEAKAALDSRGDTLGTNVVDLIEKVRKCGGKSWASVAVDVEQEAGALQQETAATDGMLSKLASTLANVNDGLQKL